MEMASRKHKEKVEKAVMSAVMNTVRTVQHDAVNHPSHYTFGKLEVITVIDDWQLNFSLGNAVKYIARAGKKAGADPIEELRKAAWYLQHEIELREAAKKS